MKSILTKLPLCYLFIKRIFMESVQALELVRVSLSHCQLVLRSPENLSLVHLFHSTPGESNDNLCYLSNPSNLSNLSHLSHLVKPPCLVTDTLVLHSQEFPSLEVSL